MKYSTRFSAGRKILFLAHPTLRPLRKDRDNRGSMAIARRASVKRESGFVFIFIAIQSIHAPSQNSKTSAIPFRDLFHGRASFAEDCANRPHPGPAA